MDLQQLRYFTAVAKHGSISAAALVLGVTQPTISQALQGLENEMRTPLFSRLGRGMVPTSAGFALLGSARRILRASAAAQDSLATRGDGMAGRLDVAVFSAVMSGVVPELIAGFLRRFPDVTVNVRTIPGEADLVRVLRERQSDVAFTWLVHPEEPPLQGEIPGLEMVPVGGSEIHRVASADDDARWVLATAGDPVSALLGDRPHALAATPGRPPVVADKRETRLGLAVAGVGSTYLNETMTGLARRAGLDAHALEPRLVQRVALVYDAGALSDLAEGFVSFVRGDDGIAPSATSRNASSAGEG